MSDGILMHVLFQFGLLALLKLHLHSRLINCLQWTGQRLLQETFKFCALILTYDYGLKQLSLYTIYVLFSVTGEPPVFHVIRIPTASIKLDAWNFNVNIPLYCCQCFNETSLMKKKKLQLLIKIICRHLFGLASICAEFAMRNRVRCLWR